MIRNTALLAFISLLFVPAFAAAQSEHSNCVNIARNLTLGSRGNEVLDLQNYLIQSGLLDAQYRSGYYGFLTAQAVGRAQLNLDILTSANDSAYGILGPRTRAALACGSGVTPLTPPVASNGSEKIRIITPDGGESYVAGSGKKLTIKWVASGIQSGDRVCVVLMRQGSTGGGFAFPGGDPGCRSVKNGAGSLSGPLTRTSGYDLGPGAYTVRVSVIGPDRNDGKDAPEVASDTSDNVFYLTDRTTYNREITITSYSYGISPKMSIAVSYENMPAAGVKILNSAGQVVWTGELTSGGGGSAALQLNVALPSGTYRAQAFGSDGTIYGISAPYYIDASIPSSAIQGAIDLKLNGSDAANQAFDSGDSAKLSWTIEGNMKNCQIIYPGKTQSMMQNVSGTGSRYVLLYPSTFVSPYVSLSCNDGARGTEVHDTIPIRLAPVESNTPANASASIDQSSLTSTSATPTITGSVANVSGMYLAVTDLRTGEAYATDNVSIANGHWSVTLNRLSAGTSVARTSLTPGSYKLTVVGPGYNALANGTLTITAPSASTATYRVYLSGVLARTQYGYTQAQASSDCQTTHASSMGSPIRCVWNGIELYSYTPPEQRIPDLTASVSGPSSATVGQSVTITGTVTNSGVGTTGSGFTGVFVTNLNAGATDWNTKNVVSFSALAPGQSISGQTTFSWNAPGVYEYAFCADSSQLWAGTVSESNESNNCSTHRTVVVSDAAAAVAQCTTAVGKRGLSGSYTCSCPAGFGTATIWGSDTYTDDSDICTAALHAGVITRDGGNVTYTMRGPQSSFSGTSRNGVTSAPYGAWPDSYGVSRASASAANKSQVAAALQALLDLLKKQ